MKTLEVCQPTTTQVDQFAMNANFCLPSEIIEEIIFRLPVKSILRFRTVSKPWLSRISDPSFTKLHLAHATAVRNTALLICTYDHSTGEHRFFSAAHDGGPVTHIMTLNKHYAYCFTEAEHLNGLVFFTFMDWFSEKSCAYVFNPSTHKIFKLPDPACLASCRHLFARYFFGFDESIKEHKILTIMECGKTTKSETMIFSMSNYSWRKIDAEPPIGFRWKSLYHDIHGVNIKSSICVNSVVHLMSRASLDILTFDLRTEKFSMIETPQGVVPQEASTMYNIPWLIKVNGCIGVVCHDRVVQSHELYIWILKDYENRVWVREVVKFPKPWIELGCPHLLDVANMDEIIFYSRKVSGNVVRLLIYNSKSRCFKSLQCTHGDRFLDPKLMWFKQISCYVESIVSL